MDQIFRDSLSIEGIERDLNGPKVLSKMVVEAIRASGGKNLGYGKVVSNIWDRSQIWKNLENLEKSGKSENI